MTGPRALITGIGMVTPIGNTTEEFWRNLISGVSGAGRITLFDPTGFEVEIAMEVKGFDPKAYMEPKAVRRTDRFTHFAAAAAAMAMEDADLTITPAEADGTAVVFNTGAGGFRWLQDESVALHTRGPGRVSPFTVPALMANMAACHLSMTYGIRGPVITSIAACASGVQAMVDALRLIRSGEAEVVLAGSAEAGVVPVAIAAMGNIGALSRRNGEPEKASRPFDRDRDGFVMGEGGGAMVIETEGHARRRGARVYAELVGGATTGDAYNVTAPDPAGYGAALAMTRALQSAGLHPEEVDYVCAHGTGTPLNDVSETRSIKKVFGEHAYRLMVSSPKSMVGHLMGAAGAVSAAACVLAIRDSVVPPTINLDNPDPECDLDYVPHVARRHEVNVAIANGFGFGGQNAVAVFRRAEA